MRGLHILITLFICIFSVQLQSQVNVRVGFTSQYTPALTNNMIFDVYNEDRPWLEKKMPKLHFMNGVQLGLRLKTNALAFEAGWERMNRNRTAFGLNPQTSKVETEELSYYINSYFVGLDMYTGRYGMGAQINFSNFKIQSLEQASETKLTYMQDAAINVRFNLAYRISTYYYFSAYLKPFVQVPMGSIDLKPFGEKLIPNAVGQISNYDQQFWFYGISLIFYNGPQE